MKKHLYKHLLVVFFVLGFGNLFAQLPMINFEAEKSLSEVRVNNFETTRLQFDFEGLNHMTVKTSEGTFTELIMPGGYSVGAPGTPKLPASNKLIEIPFGAEVEVKVLSYTTEEYRLADFGVKHPLMPVQPSLRKDQDVNDVPFQYVPEQYSKRTYIEPELASVEVLGVMRGQRLGRLTIAPVQYNPSEQTIKVYNHVEVEIRYTGSDIELTKYIKASTYSPYFESVYRQVINPYSMRDVFNDYPDLTKYPVKMIIVSHPDFEAALQPFIEWKTIQGFEIIEAYTTDIGSSASDIQDFIQSEYAAGTPEDPAPTFVVVVGDPGKVPASAIGSASGQVTDLYYASVDGDYFPDMYLGRLSARNVQELQNQLDKILYYQQYAFDDPSYLNDVTLIAGADSYWNPRVGQPTVNYGTENYFNAAHGFETVNAYLSSYAGCYDEERISVSLINYTAHCNQTVWGNPSLGVSDVHNMTNAGKYPLAVGNCCMSAQFSHSESIGEAWVRAENKGAVAYIGSAPNTHWFEDFYWAVGAFPIQGNNDGYVPSAEETTLGVYDAAFVSDYHAVASKKFVGNLAITEAHLQGYQTHSNVQWYWEGYQTFGDPSTIIYLTEGEDNVVDHLPTLPIGVDLFTVEALPGSYVAISMEGILHGAAFVGESGEVDVPITPVTDGGDVKIVVTKPQYIPYIEEIPAAALEGPFIVMDEFIINDPAGTGQANYGDTFTIDLTLKNVGADPVNEVTVLLTGEDEYITALDGDDPVTFSGMDAGETNNTSTVNNAFAFEVDTQVPDQHQASFVLLISNGEEEWTSNLRITANAPVFYINPDYVVDDSEGGDNNGRLDPGESALLIFEVTNHGHATANEAVLSLDASSPYFTIGEKVLELEPLQAGATTDALFNVDAHPSAPEGTLVDLLLLVEDGHAYETQTELVIGQTPEMVIGEGGLESNQYPFYNYYRANRSQMIYLASELGAGEKTITEVAFEIIHASSSHNQLPNFVIRMMHTAQNAFSNFLNTDNAQEVFTANPYVMPLSTGWEVWELDEHFEYDGESNLLVEIVWGRLPNWTSNYYRVASTGVGRNSVAYGFSDWDDVPSYSGNSSVRPNILLSFAADETEDAKTLSFLVKDGVGNLLENAGVSIGSMTAYTDHQGTTSFSLLSGVYQYYAEKEGFYPVEDQVDLTDDMIEEVILSSGEIMPGDANCDGVVDVLDVVTIVNYYQGNDPEPFCFENADVNGDGVIDVLDVMATINIFTQGKSHPYPGMQTDPAHVYLHRDGISVESDGSLSGLQFELTGNGLHNLDMSLELPGYEFVYTTEQEMARGMIFSMDNKPFPPVKTRLVSFDHAGDMPSWGDVIAGNMNAMPVTVFTSLDDPTGIDAFTDDIGFSVYPNPATDRLWVELTIRQPERAVVSLINAHGQVVETREYGEAGPGKIYFNLKGLSPGLYMVRLTHGHHFHIEKIILN